MILALELLKFLLHRRHIYAPDQFRTDLRLRADHRVFHKKGGILWNVIGPEGGWSKGEIEFFNKNKIAFVKLSESILRTSTATVSATSILSQWRNHLKLIL